MKNILITDSFDSLDELSNKYDIANFDVMRMANYSGSWGETFPFDPSKKFNLSIRKDNYFTQFCKNKKIIVDICFFTPFEKIGLMLIDFNDSGIRDIVINYDKKKFKECSSTYIEKITNRDYLKKFAICKRLLNARIFTNKPMIKNIHHLNLFSNFLSSGLDKTIYQKLVDKKIVHSMSHKDKSGIFWPILDVCTDDIPVYSSYFNKYEKCFFEAESSYNRMIFNNRIMNLIRDEDLKFSFEEYDDWYLDTYFDFLYLESMSIFSLYRGAIVPSLSELSKINSLNKDSIFVYKSFMSNCHYYFNSCREIVNKSYSTLDFCKKLWNIKL